MTLIQGPKMGLSGRYNFTVQHPDTRKTITGRDGMPVYRDGSGFVRRAGVWHPNLITDRGLDQFQNELWLDPDGIRDYVKVGTGTATPDVTDATLAAYHGESTSTGPGNDAYLASYNTDAAPEYHFKGTKVGVFTASGAVTLTEFGFDAASGDNASVRELLRDGAGDPTTVALTNGQTISVQHEAFLYMPEETTVAFDVVEKNLAGTTVATESYTGVIYAVYGIATYGSTFGYLEPSSAKFADDLYFQSVGFTKPAGIGTGTHINQSAANDLAGNPTLLAYTAGDHYVDIRMSLDSTDQLPSDADVKAILTGYISVNDLDVGYALLLDDTQSIPKANTHSLTLTMRMAWGRA